ncbi:MULTISPECIES: cupin domain-containing protein [unclassified Bradyrhizobium]|jgi:quercetin dioxygenase-like cupin family protein|uniref:cupin domain-containing protein n=1 Tax=unclassified Bradyrhizobium TaxID=2631580 RepID=UPI002FF2BC85
MRCSLGLVTTIVVLAAAPLYAQQAPLPTVTPPPGLKATVLVTETQVTGVPDKVFVLLTAEFAPGSTTRRHTHPGDEYGTVVEGTIVTQQAGGEWKTVTAGESYYVPAWVVHETKNITDKPARTYNAFIIEKGKPRVIPAE